jgi:hypothetical protein
LKNGVKVGKRTTGLGQSDTPMIGLSLSECKSMGGNTIDGPDGLCLRPGFTTDELFKEFTKADNTPGPVSGKRDALSKVLKKYTFSGLCLDA